MVSRSLVIRSRRNIVGILSVSVFGKSRYARFSFDFIVIFFRIFSPWISSVLVEFESQKFDCRSKLFRFLSCVGSCIDYLHCRMIVCQVEFQMCFMRSLCLKFLCAILWKWSVILYSESGTPASTCSNPPFLSRFLDRRLVGRVSVFHEIFENFWIWFFIIESDACVPACTSTPWK